MSFFDFNQAENLWILNYFLWITILSKDIIYLKNHMGKKPGVSLFIFAPQIKNFSNEKSNS